MAAGLLLNVEDDWRTRYSLAVMLILIRAPLTDIAGVLMIAEDVYKRLGRWAREAEYQDSMQRFRDDFKIVSAIYSRASETAQPFTAPKIVTWPILRPGLASSLP